MSTTSLGRFGAAKTYGRRRETNASPAADDMAGKPAPIKASPAHTKWGKTNFVAVREDKKSVYERSVPKEPETKKEVKTEDPFSFDTDDKSKVKKVQRTVVVAEPQKKTTRLPASRIGSQGKGSQDVTDKDFVGVEGTESSVTRPLRTYTRSQEGRANTGPSVPASQLIMNQFVEVGKTMRTDSGIEVVYSVPPHEPSSTNQVPDPPPAERVLPVKKPSPQKPVAEPPVLLKEPRPARPAPVSEDEDDDDDDIFTATFRRTPLKTYTGEIITPIKDIPDDPPPRKRRRGGRSGLPRGRKPSRYSDPRLIEEYKRRYEETHGKREPTAGLFNSTVVSSKELRGTQGTTLVVVCKPKVEVSEKKDDVQTKYFKNVKKELDKADKNLEAAGEAVPQENAKSKPAPPKPARPAASATPSPIIKKPAASQDSGSATSTPGRTLRVRFADEQTAANTLTSLSTSVPQKQPTRSATAQKAQANQELVSANAKENAGKDASDKNDKSIASRTRSGGKQYRIFKSRGPPKPAGKEPAKPADSESENKGNKPDSPPMPELTPEAPMDSEDTSGKGQGPPVITNDNEINTAAQPSAVPQENEAPVTQPLTNSQKSQEAPQTAQDISDGQEKVAEESSSSQVASSKTRDSPVVSESQDSPVVSDSQNSSVVSESQDSSVVSETQDSPMVSEESPQSSQEVVSAESGQEDSAPAVPRRFFKSKKAATASSLQRKVFEKSPSKASYNVRSWQQDGGDKDSETGPPPAKQAKKVLPFSEEPEKEVVKTTREPRLTRSVHWPKDRDQEAYTSVKVNKRHKELYTVVHNVKMAYEVQESGETQDFMDDVEYLLDNLQDNQPVSIRALSTIQLAGKCISPAFRMHLRAHGTVTKIFSLLHDACSSPILALSTASMMFMLSRDRLNMDLDKDSLHLMLKLNEIDMPRAHHQGTTEQPDPETGDDGELEKWRQRVQELLVQLQKETNAKQIDLDFVSTGNLAMESLLSLTSRRAGEWFKEELRTLGGLDHFVESIHRCGSVMKGDLASNLDNYTPNLRKLDRCLRVLENITFTNSDNQHHIISYSEGLLITATGRILAMCVECLPTMPLQEVENEVELREQAGWIVFDCLLAILRVLLNITHDSEQGSTRVGQEKGLLNTVLMCVASTQWCVPPDQRFDLLILSLGLLVNLMEFSPSNRQHLVQCSIMAQLLEDQDPSNMQAVHVIVQLFLQRESAARQMEEAPETPSKGNDSINKSGEWRESDSGIEWITKSAEKVKAAEAESKETAIKEGEKNGDDKTKGEGDGEETTCDTDKSTSNASILEDEETFTKALHKAGKHMENSIVASYAGLLLGCLIQDNKDYVEIVRKHLPEGSFESMIKILKKFLGFMNLTTAVGTTDANSIQRVIDTLEAC